MFLPNDLLLVLLERAKGHLIGFKLDQSLKELKRIIVLIAVEIIVPRSIGQLSSYSHRPMKKILLC